MNMKIVSSSGLFDIFFFYVWPYSSRNSFGLVLVLQQIKSLGMDLGAAMQLLGRCPRKNCKKDVDDQTRRKLFKSQTAHLR